MESMLERHRLFEQFLLDLDAVDAMQLSLVCQQASKTMVSFVGPWAFALQRRHLCSNVMSLRESLRQLRNLSVALLIQDRDCDVLSRALTFTLGRTGKPYPTERAVPLVRWMCVSRNLHDNTDGEIDSFDGVWEFQGDLEKGTAHVNGNVVDLTVKSVGFEDYHFTVDATVSTEMPSIELTTPAGDTMRGERANGKITWTVACADGPSSSATWVRVEPLGDIATVLVLTASMTRSISVTILVSLVDGRFAVVSSYRSVAGVFMIAGAVGSRLEAVLESARRFGRTLTMREGRLLWECTDEIDPGRWSVTKGPRADHVDMDAIDALCAGERYPPKTHIKRLERFLSAPVPDHIASAVLRNETCLARGLVNHFARHRQKDE